MLSGATDAGVAGWRSRLPRIDLRGLVGPWLLVPVLGALGVGIALSYSLSVQIRYRATATMLASPVPADDPTFLGVDVLKDDGGRQLAAATAATLVTTPEVADAVLVRLGLERSRSSLLGSVSARPVGRSAAVAVTATDADPARAAELANAFVDATIASRSAGFQSEVTSAIQRLTARRHALPPQERGTGIGEALQARIAALQALVGVSDPTLRHASDAVAPSSPSWPKPGLLAMVGGLIGLALGFLLLGVIAVSPALRRVLARWAPEPGGSSPGLEDRERRLEDREASHARRERELVETFAERSQELERRAEVLAAGEREQTQRDGSLTAQRAQIEQRDAAVSKRERVLADAESRLDERMTELEELAPPPPVPVAATDFRAPGPWTLDELRGLVERADTVDRARAEEWSAYVLLLGDYADADGRIPSRFDWLIEETFGELVPR